MKLKVDALFWSADNKIKKNKKNIVDGASLIVNSGEFTGVIGPNGSGKTSLIRCVYRLNKPNSGIITLDGDNVWELDIKDFARRAAAVPQEMPGQFDFTAREIVAMGRYPHKKILERDSSRDNELINKALEYVGMLNHAERMFSSLSGGEKQRTLIARAIAQDTGLLILDEPTNHLDIYYQLEIMDLIKNLTRNSAAERKIASLVVMHDLNLAARYCDRVYVMNRGQIYADGRPDDIFTPELISSVYKVRAKVIKQNKTDPLQIIFTGTIK